LTLFGAIAAISSPTATVAAGTATTVSSAVSRAERTQPGIQWETSLKAARAKARRTGKPLLLLHLFGRLDEEFC
jgi:hypothetical protein